MYTHTQEKIQVEEEYNGAHSQKKGRYIQT